MISTAQIRAARALLNWTQGDLARRTGLSLRALNSIERGLSAPRLGNLQCIQEAFEKENIEFGDNDGVRRKTERLDIVKLEGANLINEHLIDVMRELRAPGSEALYNLASEEMLPEIDPEVMNNYFAHLGRQGMRERVLLAAGETHIVSKPSWYRWMKPEAFNHVCYVVYGDNVAFHILSKPHRVIIMRNPGIADMFRLQFESNWAMAETPWFAKQYKMENPNEPWSVDKANAAREWIAAMKKKRGS